MVRYFQTRPQGFSHKGSETYYTTDLLFGAEAADLPREPVRFSVVPSQIAHLRVDDILGELCALKPE